MDTQKGDIPMGQELLDNLLRAEKSISRDLTPSELVTVLKKLSETKALINDARSLEAQARENMRAVASIMGLGEYEN